MKVLQVFHRYLDHSSNWAFRLIRDLECEKLSIASTIFLNDEYEISQATLLKPLLKIYPRDKEGLLLGLFRKLNQLYLNWLIKKTSASFEIIHAHFAPTGCRYLQLAKKLNKKLVV